MDAKPSFIDPILSEIEACLVITGLSASRFGTEAIGDPTLVRELRRGRKCNSLTQSRVRAFIREQELSSREKA